MFLGVFLSSAVDMCELSNESELMKPERWLFVMSVLKVVALYHLKVCK